MAKRKHDMNVTEQQPQPVAQASSDRAQEPAAIDAPTAAHKTQGRPILDRYGQDRRFWPADRPMPDGYRKVRRGLQPCPRCRRVLTDDGGQAVVCRSSRDHMVFLRCRVCSAQWQLPVKYD